MTLKFAMRNSVFFTHYISAVGRVTCSVLLLTSLSCANAALPPRIEQALSKAGISPDSIAIVARPLQGAPLLTHNADRPMRSASVMKLLTTYAALERLGPNWTWKTEAYALGPIKDGILDGPLLLKGYGDPSLTLERFWLLTQQLKQQGLKSIKGGVIVDVSHFDSSPTQASSLIDDPWEVVPNALMINLQAERLFFERQGDLTKVRVEPELGWKIKLDMPLVEGPCREDIEDEWKPSIEWIKGTPTASIHGKFPTGCDTRILNLGITDSVYYAGAIFRQLWEGQGGSLEGATRAGTLPENAMRIAQLESPPLSQAIIGTNKFSSNPMARAIYLSIGRTYQLPNQTSASSADAVIKRWLKEKKLLFPELVQETGCGLSRREQLSAAHWVDLLISAANSPFSAELTASLPILGMDGTMKKRLRSEPAMGWGHFKTGTLSDTKALAGYLTTAKGRQLAITVLINSPALGRRADPVFEEILRVFFEDNFVEN